MELLAQRIYNMSSFYNSNNRHKNSWHWLLTMSLARLLMALSGRCRYYRWLRDWRVEIPRAKVTCPRSHCCLVKDWEAARCLGFCSSLVLGKPFCDWTHSQFSPCLRGFDSFSPPAHIRPSYWSWEDEEPNVTFLISHWLKTIIWECAVNKNSHQQGTER